MSRVFLGVPVYDSVQPLALDSLTAVSRNHNWNRQVEAGGALIAHTFNTLWCKALNSRADQRWDLFAMHHDDIAAELWWLDKLHDIRLSLGVDVLSVIMPIKDDRGVTSSGWMDPVKQQIHRFTMDEIYRMPESFTADMVKPGKWLAMNTGLWVCEFTKPWVEDENIAFSVPTAIKKHCDGLFRPHVLSEDWNFSRWCGQNGIKIGLTRAVGASHYGVKGWDNRSPWGSCKTDPGDYKLPEMDETLTYRKVS